MMQRGAGMGPFYLVRIRGMTMNGMSGSCLLVCYRPRVCIEDMPGPRFAYNLLKGYMLRCFYVDLMSYIALLKLVSEFLLSLSAKNI